MFGSQDISPEEEIQLLKQILCAPLPRQHGPEEQGAEEEEEEEEEEEGDTWRLLPRGTSDSPKGIHTATQHKGPS